MKTIRLLLAAGASTLLWQGTAQAYCRTRTCELDNQFCNYDFDTGCSGVGEPLFWPRGCVALAVQADGSPDEGMTAAELERVVADGFGEWTRANCGKGTTPAIAFAARGSTACDRIGYDQSPGAENDDIIMFRDDDWEYGDVRLALTTVTANLVSGEIIDADIELNSQDYDFTLDAPNADRQDLRLVLYHELGHLLGLSHSQETDAIMQSNYDSGTSDLGLDDIGGICAAYPNAAADPECSADPLPAGATCVGAGMSSSNSSNSDPDDRVIVEDGGCAYAPLAPAGSRGASWLTSALLLLGLARVRRGLHGRAHG